jgi:hypothetical protein
MMKRSLLVIVIVLVLAPVVASAAIRQSQARTAGPTMALLFTTGSGWDQAKSPNEQRGFQSHSANLRRLRDAGVIVAGGRFGDYGLILVSAPTVDSATAMVKPDSSLIAGTFKVAVTPWSTIYEGAITR